MNKYIIALLIFVFSWSGLVVAQGMQTTVVVSPRGEAYKRLSDLENEKHMILLSIDRIFMPDQQQRLKEIENEIYKIKNFLGDVFWNKKAKIFFGTIALLGLSVEAVNAYFQYLRYERSKGWS